MRKSYIPAAVLSGLFAALSSVFAKLFTDERTGHFYHNVLQVLSKQDIMPLPSWALSPDSSLLAIRGVCFALIFASNSLMWTLFTKALNAAPSSVQVTIVNGASNFSASAILGLLVFDEPLALRWWVGACFILSGTLLLSRAQKQKVD